MILKPWVVRYLLSIWIAIHLGRAWSILPSLPFHLSHILHVLWVAWMAGSSRTLRLFSSFLTVTFHCWASFSTSIKWGKWNPSHKGFFKTMVTHEKHLIQYGTYNKHTINKSSYYDQDRQHSTLVKNSGFGIRLPGFPSTFTGCVTLRKLYNLCLFPLL